MGQQYRACLAGVLIMFDLTSAVVFACAFWLTLFVTRYVSVSSITGVTAAFFYVLFTQVAEVSVIMLILAGLVIIKHRANLQRLTAGTENKFSWKENG